MTHEDVFIRWKALLISLYNQVNENTFDILKPYQARILNKKKKHPIIHRVIHNCKFQKQRKYFIARVTMPSKLKVMPFVTLMGQNK